MSENENKTPAEEVMQAIQLATSGLLQKENDGVNLLSIVKKVARNRKKGESLE
jgi:hypothetical protein